ncbi:MAG: TIGR03086 family metal-binding protein [Acidimicrobiales bacterium]|nr:TIGR03086 family metal-binding protein [Acidimicrobiales bacterium]
MTVIDRYRTLSEEMAARVAAVPDDAWTNPTPCADWTARDLVRHLVEAPRMFFGMVEVPPPADGPPVDDDPSGAFAVVRTAVLDALGDPAVADKEFDGLSGRQTFAQAIDRFICADLVVHGWDLARSTGQDEHVDPDEARRIHESLEPMEHTMRGPGAFGPATEPPPDADEPTKLLCFLGREV